MSKYQNHIISNPEILLGKPVIQGTRISVEFILKKLSEGATFENLAKQHKLSHEEIYAVLDYASARLADR
ncbi:MAG TPA: DUF433 domain-containing protein, partial [Pricia sp.]|nr:DUF433 domain-containing protein [Pricia sp.]